MYYTASEGVIVAQVGIMALLFIWLAQVTIIVKTQWHRLQGGLAGPRLPRGLLLGQLAYAESCATTSTLLFLPVVARLKLAWGCLPMLQSHLPLQCRRTLYLFYLGIPGISFVLETTR